MKLENREMVKSMMLEILAECDPSFSDILINRVHPIVKQLVQHEFNEKRNELLLEVAVTLGKIMQGRSKTLLDIPLELEVNPAHAKKHMMGK